MNLIAKKTNISFWLLRLNVVFGAIFTILGALNLNGCASGEIQGSTNKASTVAPSVKLEDVIKRFSSKNQEDRFEAVMQVNEAAEKKQINKEMVKGVAESLLELLKDESGGVRVKTIEALTAIGEPSVAGLIRRLGSKDKRTAALAATAIVQIGEHSVSQLAEALNAPEEELRKTIVSTLGKIGSDSLISKEALAKALTDKSRKVRDVAKWFLNRAKIEAQYKKTISSKKQWEKCINAIEKVVFGAREVKEWFKNCASQIDRQGEDKNEQGDEEENRLISCGYRGPTEKTELGSFSERPLEWEIHSNWTEKITVELNIEYSILNETVYEIDIPSGLAIPLQINEGSLTKVREFCLGMPPFKL